MKTTSQISDEFCQGLWSGPGSYETTSSGSPEQAHHGDCVSMLPCCSQQLECSATERKDKSLVTSLVSVWHSCSICAAAEITDGLKRGKAVVPCNRHTSDSAEHRGLRFWTAVLKSNFVMLSTASTETVYKHSEQSRLRLLLTALTLPWVRKTALLPRPNAPTILRLTVSWCRLTAILRGQQKFYFLSFSIGLTHDFPTNSGEI